MKRQRVLQIITILAAVTLLLGCNKTPVPTQAANDIEKAFANSDAVTKATVSAASEAMQQAQYDQAVISLTTIQPQQISTPEQLRAIQTSYIALRTELSRRADAGDQKAKASLELLKELRRDR